MRLLIQKNQSNISAWTADYIAKRMSHFKPQKENPFVICLPTGSSPLGVYSELIKKHREDGLSFKNVISFNLDEYVGLSPEHPQSYAYYMKKNFFDLVDILPANTNIPNGLAPDLEAECNSYEEKILAVGGIELLLGGMGNDGHIAFNEPGSSLASRTRVKTLTRDTLSANARFFDGKIENVPRAALTMGIGTIMDAREVLIIVSGNGKARALKAAVEGSVSHWLPLSCLQMHKRAIIVCDEDAASDLEYKTVQYFQDIERAHIL